jgi:glycosyltransferase involved in cell wall biosynthesis
MSKIIFIPIEKLPARYTEMMYESVQRYLTGADLIVYPNVDIDTQIKRGQFLDIVNTCKFKSAQLQEIATLFNDGKIHDGDVFLVGDIFFPGIESIRYMAELLNIKVKIYGINYAGRADSTDFVQNLSKWADASELGYHLICDGIFVGSEDHKRNVVSYFNIPEETVHVTGLIWDLDYMNKFKEMIGNVEKEDFIIWPHRWCNEKGIDELRKFAEYSNKKIIVTSSGPVKDVGPVPSNIEFKFNLTKLSYFRLMAKARWYLSTGFQETFGFTLQEAILFNCNILVPDRACYAEMVPDICIYNDISEIDEKFDNQDLTVPYDWTWRWNGNAKLMLDICRGELNSVPENYFIV